MFKRLKLGPWRQFAEVDISFSRLTVLTGPNGCGKTTILSILANHFNWRNRIIAAPKRSDDGGLYYTADAPNNGKIGSISYDSDRESEISVPEPKDNHY
jgi:recombinational DNA repair ATPase RecF